MSPITLNLVAIAIFSITMTSLLGGLFGLSPAVPAAIAAGLMGIVSLDNFALEGRGGTLLVDGLAQFSADHRKRIIHHEAGHFLVAHLLGIAVTGYSLSAWEAFRQGKPGRGGVSFETPEIEDFVKQGQLPATVVDQYATVWMAGIAAEQLVYGSAEGGYDDRQTLRVLWQQFRRPQSECEVKARWSILKAKTLLESHRAAYDALVAAMEERLPVETCLALIKRHTEPGFVERAA